MQLGHNEKYVAMTKKMRRDYKVISVRNIQYNKYSIVQGA